MIKITCCILLIVLLTGCSTLPISGNISINGNITNFDIALNPTPVPVSPPVIITPTPQPITRIDSKVTPVDSLLTTVTYSDRAGGMLLITFMDLHNSIITVKIQPTDITPYGEHYRIAVREGKAEGKGRILVEQNVAWLKKDYIYSDRSTEQTFTMAISGGDIVLKKHRGYRVDGGDVVGSREVISGRPIYDLVNVRVTMATRFAGDVVDQ